VGVSAAPTVTIVVTASSVGTFSNSVSVDSGTSDPTPGNNSDTESTTVRAPQADLSLTKADSPDPVQTGQTLTYTLTVDNDGPQAAQGVTVTDTLPAEVTFSSANASQGTCSGTDTVTCDLGTIGNGGQVTVTIEVTPQSAGTVTNSATVSTTTDDPVSANDTDSEDTTVEEPPDQADLSLTKADSQDPVQTGETLTYTLTVDNGGPDAAQGVTVTDTLPSGVAFSSANASQGSCSGTQTVSCDLGTIADGGQATVTIEVTPQSAGTLTNSATVSAGTEDPAGANDTDSEDTTVEQAPGPARCPGYENAKGHHVIGTASRDLLIGTDGRDFICGFGGNDLLRGLGGDDVLLGGGEKDRLVGGPGDDFGRGGRGRDVAIGGPGADRFGGGQQNDDLRGGPGPDSLRGRRGNDTALGGPGGDVLGGGGGADSLMGGRGPDVLHGKDSIRGNDLVAGGAGVDTCGADPRDRVKGC
jgi:uncharacterized repeat protein (TIGR01451 family)